MARRQDVELVLRSRTPVIVIETRDESRMLGMLKEIALGSARTTCKPLFR